MEDYTFIMKFEKDSPQHKAAQGAADCMSLYPLHIGPIYFGTVRVVNIIGSEPGIVEVHFEVMG